MSIYHVSIDESYGTVQVNITVLFAGGSLNDMIKRHRVVARFIVTGQSTTDIVLVANLFSPRALVGNSLVCSLPPVLKSI